MRVTCDVIRDVLPLYLEDMASEGSYAMIEEHLAQCEACKNYLDEMKAFITPPVDIDISPLLKIKSTMRKKKLQTAVFSMMLSLVIGVIAMAFLTAPEYLPHGEASVTINEIGNGSVLALFADTVSGYDINRYATDDNTGYVYHITTWDSIWNRSIKKSRANNTLLNPNGENVVAVYYYLANGGEDVLIYGNNMNPGGGVVTLPRLFLAYYSLIAMVLAAVCGLTMMLFRGNKRVVNMTLKVLLLPVSYLIGQLAIKGFRTSSYTATRDFYAILLIMIPLYIAFLAALNLIREYKSRKI